MTNKIIGIDATRNHSGGAIEHIKGLISGSDPRDYGITQVHLWSYPNLLDQLSVYPWLYKHKYNLESFNILIQLIWQRFYLNRYAKKYGVEVMFNTNAGTICGFQPSVTLSQNMLSFEPGEIKRFPLLSKERIRLEVLRHVQIYSLKNCQKALYLSEYAKNVINSLAKNNNYQVISHGIPNDFHDLELRNNINLSSKIQIKCLYISNAAPYKHQWNVIEAISLLKKNTKKNISLKIIGGGHGASYRKMTKAAYKNDPLGKFIELVDFLPHDQIISELIKADLFIFASSCENLPITLLEAMASSIPIISSDKGPMKEILGEGFIYFDPSKIGSIYNALDEIINKKKCIDSLCITAKNRSKKYTWKKCSEKTWELLSSI